MGQTSTGAASVAVYDAKGRSITAAGFVPSGPATFVDTTKIAGLASWSHHMGEREKSYILDTIGSGIGLFDFDKDGWLDIYLVNGSTSEALKGEAPPAHAALFRNNHDGTFTDVAAKAGVTNDRWGFGVAVGDYDNDGWPDMYVTNFGKNRLFHNNHDGTFTDTAGQAGVELGNWSTGATFGDYDGDGRLDLFVPGYVHYDAAQPPLPGTSATSFHTCDFRGVAASCGPRGLEGEPDHLFHNEGEGKFTDVSVKAGVADAKRYYGFTGLFVDLAGNGRPDLLVANGSTPNYLYRNRADGTFEDASLAAGFAFNGEGRETASMGLATGDYRNNGRLDIAITDFSDDYKVVYRNDGLAGFSDVSEALGLGENTKPFLGWGVGFVDFDNDGWKDLLMVNGHVYPMVDQQHWGTSYAQRPLLLHNRKGLKFDAVAPVKESGLAIVASSRGAAFGDLFNRGAMDVIINNLDQPPTLLKNVAPSRHWIAVKLIGGPKSPRDAVGATLYLTANGMRQREDILSGGSFLSSNDQRAPLRPWTGHTCREPGGPLAKWAKRDDARAGDQPSLRRHRGRGRDEAAAINSWAWLRAISFLLVLGTFRVMAQGTPNTLLHQAQASIRDGKLAEAIDPLERASALAPHDSHILTTLGKVKVRLGEGPAAIPLFRRVVAETPASAEAHLNLAIVLADTGEREEGLREASLAEKLSPGDARTHLNRARLLDDLGRHEEARVEFRSAARIAPSDPVVLFNWALMEEEEGNAKEESSLLARVVLLQPLNFQANYLLGKSLAAQHRTVESLKAYRRAVELDPESSEATYALARALRVDRPMESAQLLARFKLLDERKRLIDELTDQGNEADALSRSGDWAKAIQLLDRALDRCGQCKLQAELLKHRGLAYANLGDLNAGETDLRSASHINPNDRETLDGLRWIQAKKPALTTKP